MKLSLIAVPLVFSIFSMVKNLNLPDHSGRYPDYAAAWSEIDLLIEKGLIEDALSNVERLYARSQNEKNHPQVYKCLLYIENLSSQKDELELAGIIQRLESRLGTLYEPENAMTRSVLGELYFRMAGPQANFRNGRTTISGVEQDTSDITTWSHESLVRKSNAYFLQSLESEECKQSSLQDYEAVLTKTEGFGYCETLHDVLLNRAIIHFSQAQSSLTDFEDGIPLRKRFAEMNEFLLTDCRGNTVLSLYQQWMRQLQFKADRRSLISVDLSRLQYAMQISGQDESADQLYRNALDALNLMTGKGEGKELVLQRLVEYFYADGQKETAQEGKSYILADMLCNEALSITSDTLLIKYFNEVHRSIHSPFFQLTQEKIIEPGKNSKFLVQCSNINQLHFKVYRWPINSSKDLIVDEGNISKSKINSLRLEREWTEKWDLPSDFRRHSLEIKLDALNEGRYLIVATDQNALDKSVFFKSGLFYVSGLASFSQKTEKDIKVVVVDRTTGAPLRKVKVNFFKYGRYRYDEPVKIEAVHSGITDKNGMVSISGREPLQYYLERGKDICFDGSGLPQIYQRDSREYIHLHMFLDRAIYRPGQTVHFKILAIKHDGNNAYPELVTGRNFDIVMRNANYQEVSTQRLRTNSFGSASGSIVIPPNGLTGQFSIGCDNGQAYFRVEEYKRPSFEVKFDTMNDVYQLDQSVRISGTVVTFNGIPVAGAVIKYRINRQALQPYLYRMDFGRDRFSPQTQIESGSVKANEEGQFLINFIATGIKGEHWTNAVQNFTVEVDATDLNQETRSNILSFSLSNKNLFVSAMLPEYSFADSDSIELSAKNILGVTLPVNYQAYVYEIMRPQGSLRSRLWEKPDIDHFSEKEFHQYFPDDIYADEDQAKYWKVVRKVTEFSLNGNQTASKALKDLNLSPGEYKVVIHTTIDNNISDTVEVFTTVLSASSKTRLTHPGWLTRDAVLEPGQEAAVVLLPALSSAYVMYQWKSKVGISGGWKKLSSPEHLGHLVTEDERGDIEFEGISIWKNRVFRKSHRFEVPWTNKELDITSVSFRDKLLPGQEEEWIFKIKDNKSVSEKYEMLASMYDQSLDQIMPFSWDFNIRPSYFSADNFNCNTVYTYYLNEHNNIQDTYGAGVYYNSACRDLNLFGVGSFDGGIVVMDAMPTRSGAMNRSAPMKEMDDNSSTWKSKSENSTAGQANNTPTLPPTVAPSKHSDQLNHPVRKNLNETVFFYPQLESNQNGEVSLRFTMNEAMTRWKLQMLAHSPTLKYGYSMREVITSKPLQIKPYYPRFLRQGDEMKISATVSNLTDHIQQCRAVMQILDVSTMNDVTKEIIAGDTSIAMNISASTSEAFIWKLKIPDNENRALLMRFFCHGEAHSDGEEMIVPVHSNLKLVTETLPLPVRGNESKTFSFGRLKNMKTETGVPQLFTIEFTSHPVWYAVQSLPFLAAYPHECSEQLMTRIFANTLGSRIMNKYPKVATTLSRMLQKGELKSRLLENPELKSALIEETPWVIDAQNETEQFKQLALLMDLNYMRNQLTSAVLQLKQRQNGDGSFSWFPGCAADRFITQHILTQIAHLKRLGIEDSQNGDLLQIAINARGFLDNSIYKDYDWLASEVKAHRANWEDMHLNSIQLHYYYCKSYFNDWETDATKAYVDNYYMNQITSYWNKLGIYDQGLCALVLYRSGHDELAQKILKSLMQRSLYQDEVGRYWKPGWNFYWNMMPVETQALMIEVFGTIGKDNAVVEEMKTWLIKNKQANHWGTTKASSEAIYALLSNGESYIDEQSEAEVRVGGHIVTGQTSTLGSGYMKRNWTNELIQPELAEIKIRNPNKSIAWGAAYYQYFEKLDKITRPDMKELIITKQLYRKDSKGKETTLQPVSAQSRLLTGDLVIARIIIKCDRPMEYVHLKVMRAAGLEPINQLSGYRYQGGLAFYESPRDQATDFFIPFINKGTYVLEYELRASFKGQFSDGIASIQSMYAPEFSAHGEGIRLQID